MYYVYILQSQKDREKRYVGITGDIERRVAEHNNNPACAYTKSYRPWKMKSYIAVQQRETARNLEKYLKHGSGHAFLKKHFI